MEAQQLSVWLNRSAFPRAIADFERQYFVSWNSTFLERTGYSENRLKVIRPEQIIVLGDEQSPLSSSSGLPSAEFIKCVVRTALQPAVLSGHVLKALRNLGYIMLQDVELSASTKFEEGRMLGQEEQRARLIQMVHDAVSPSLLGAIFAIEWLKEIMQAENLPHAEIALRASELLTEAVEKLSDVLEGTTHADQHSPDSS
jgi:hypothetical protein